MQLTVLGSSPAHLSPDGRSSGYLVSAGSTSVLLECGHGVSGALAAHADITTLDAIVISHMHPDHFFDLVPLHYAYRARGKPGPPLWLPPDGTAVLDAICAPLGLDADFFSRTHEIHEYEPGVAIMIGELRFEFRPTKHFIPAYCMRITPVSAEHPALFFSADTAWLDSLPTFASGADLALVEATEPEMNDQARRGHLTGEQAGQLAQEAHVARLLLTHCPAEIIDHQLAQARSVFEGVVEHAVEGQTYEV